MTTRHELAIGEDSWIDVLKLPNDKQEVSSFCFDQIWNLHPEEYSTIFIHGKYVDTPRWSKEYITPYTWSGVKHEAHALPKLLQPFFDWANSTPYGPFNQLLVNWYANGLHYIGAHRDAEPEIASDSPIMSITLGPGTERKFRLRDYYSKKIELDIPITDGDVVVLSAMANKMYTHEIPKVQGAKGLSCKPRISITLRRFHSSS